MVKLFLPYLAVYNNEKSANSVKICQGRANVLPNTKSTFKKYEKLSHFCQSGHTAFHSKVVTKLQSHQTKVERVGHTEMSSHALSWYVSSLLWGHCGYIWANFWGKLALNSNIWSHCLWLLLNTGGRIVFFAIACLLRFKYNSKTHFPTTERDTMAAKRSWRIPLQMIIIWVDI